MEISRTGAQPEVVQRVDTPSPFTEAGKAGSWDSLWEAKRQALRSDALNKANAEAFNAGSGRMNAEASMLRAQNEPIIARERMDAETKRAEALNKKALADENRADRKEQAEVEKDMFKATDKDGKEVFDAAKHGRFLQFKSRFDAQGIPYKNAGELKRSFDAHEAQLAVANKGLGSADMTGEPMSLKRGKARLLDFGSGGVWGGALQGSDVYEGTTPSGKRIVIDPSELPDTPEQNEWHGRQGLTRAARK